MAKTALVKTKKEIKAEILDPRQSLFLAAYTDPKSKTFANALQSALAAGYSQLYAENITGQLPSWLSDNLGKGRRVKQAEQHLDEVLELPIITQVNGAFGPVFEKRVTYEKKKLKNGKFRKVKVVENIPVFAPNVSIIKEKSKVAQFALESLDKANYGKTIQKLGLNFNFHPAKGKELFTS